MVFSGLDVTELIVPAEVICFNQTGCYGKDVDLYLTFVHLVKVYGGLAITSLVIQYNLKLDITIHIYIFNYIIS
jgi:hypothetical protein